MIPIQKCPWCWSVTAFMVACFWSSLCAAQTQRPTKQLLQYTFTVFVDEGRGELNGHVFVRLSDGTNNLYRGFYPSETQEEVFGKPVALLGFGGEFRDDRLLADQNQWDVKRTYNISKQGFDNALRGIQTAREQGQKWWLTQHCGDFAEALANSAGVPLHLPWQIRRGRTRPQLFGEYLRTAV